MDAPPSEVFSHAEELTEIGLDVPQVTQVFARLRELGLPVRPDVYTVGFGSKVLLALKGGGHA
jgi:hypothetical protein